MNIVTTTSVFPDGHPAEDSLIRLAKLGYTHVYEFGGLSDWRGEITIGAE